MTLEVRRPSRREVRTLARAPRATPLPPRAKKQAQNECRENDTHALRMHLDPMHGHSQLVSLISDPLLDSRP
jgi:hypothetical protein